MVIAYYYVFVLDLYYFIIVYLKAWGIKKDSVPYVTKIELTNIPVEGGVVDSNVN